MSYVRKATLYRMALPEHVCPYGLRARHLLKSHGYDVAEFVLRTPEEVAEFKAKWEIETTPLVMINGERVGGTHELEQLLAEEEADQSTH